MYCRPQCNTFPQRCRTRCGACNYNNNYVQQKCPPCPPCPPCPQKQNQTAKAMYYYLEKTPTKDDTSIRRSLGSRPSSAGSTKSPTNSIDDTNSIKRSIGSRPSSAGNTKQAQNKNINGNSSKYASSDSKILRKNKDASKNKSTKSEKNNKILGGDKKDSQLDPASVEQLKHDLNTIKDQLKFLTDNKDSCSTTCPDLQARCDDLMQQNSLLAEEIENLKSKNETLTGQLNNQTVLEGDSLNEIRTTKNCLDKYETTLNSLYNELLSSTKAIEQKMTCCCKAASLTQEISKSSGDEANYEKLMKKYQKLKANEQKYLQQNELYQQTIQDLENQLDQTLMQLDLFREEAAAASMRQQQMLNETARNYSYQLELKSKQINELSSAVEDLKSQSCCYCNNQSGDTNTSNPEYQQLMSKYEEVVEKLKIHEETNIARFQEIQNLKKKEKELVMKLGQLQNYSQNIKSASNENNLTITKMNNSIKELQNVIQNQQHELASKNKQIEIFLKSEESLKKRIMQLQEEIVSSKISSKPNTDDDDFNVLVANECSIHLTEELQDLITALYEEIDKTLAKDEHIKKQNRNICCLQCVLSDKEKELSVVRNELKILREQFNSTLKEKQAMSVQLKKLNGQNAELEEEEFSKQCFCESGEM